MDREHLKKLIETEGCLSKMIDGISFEGLKPRKSSLCVLAFRRFWASREGAEFRRNVEKYVTLSNKNKSVLIDAAVLVLNERRKHNAGEMA